MFWLVVAAVVALGVAGGELLRRRFPRTPHEPGHTVDSSSVHAQAGFPNQNGA